MTKKSSLTPRSRSKRALTEPSTNQNFKVIVILDCYRQDNFSILDVKENAPDFIDLTLCQDHLPEGTAYRFSHPCLYTDFNDFDLDRAEQLDNFAPETAALWIRAPQPANHPDTSDPLTGNALPVDPSVAHLHRFKTILILDCEHESNFSVRDVFENAPLFIDFELAMAVRKHEAAFSEPISYRFGEACVYVDINDFDLDRAAKVDHFAPEVAQYWLTGGEWQPEVSTAN